MNETTELLVYSGKSKDVFESKEFRRKYRFVFTDRATGYINDKNKVVFNPGYDTVVGEIPGKGATACKFATFFFKLLKEKGIPTHYIETISENEMIVEPAMPLGMAMETPEFPGSAPLVNLEFTFRNNGTGSFWRRYPFIKPCKNLRQILEAWTKGEKDILITFEALEAAGVLKGYEIYYIKELVKQIATIVSEEFALKGLHVIDGKFELGRLKKRGNIVLIDEISPDVLRVCKGFAPDVNGDCLNFRQCIETTFSSNKRTIEAKNQVPATELIKLFL